MNDTPGATVAPSWMYIPKADGRDAPLNLPDPFFTRYGAPEKYDPGEALKAAVNIALLLGQPLLLTGEPGCGKTSLAYWLAYQMGLEKPLSQVVKSTMSGKDLLYSFDVLARFRDAEGGAGVRRPLPDYLEFSALGKAILFSGGPEQRLEPDAAGDAPGGEERPKTNREIFRGDFPADRRQVVLIDELDKAPRDTPNDLLSEIERMEFHIPELGVSVQGDKDHRPVVVITSNSDKSLPEPFLRRCVYHHIPAPDETRRKEIVALRQPPLARRQALFDDAMRTFETIRSEVGTRGRQPGTAELLAWLDTVDRIYPASAASLMEDSGLLAMSLSTLAKTVDDLTLVKQILSLQP
jgi:MoxR-like ATPase